MRRGSIANCNMSEKTVCFHTVNGVIRMPLVPRNIMGRSARGGGRR